MKKLITIFVLCLILCGCNQNKNSIESIIKDDNYMIIDVRTEEEYNALHIKGAINIPYNELDENTNLDKKKTIYVYCRSGNRSSKAYSILTELGYKVEDLGALKDINLPKE